VYYRADRILLSEDSIDQGRAQARNTFVFAWRNPFRRLAHDFERYARPVMIAFMLECPVSSSSSLIEI
jgi:hypothetical protein